MGIKMTVSDVEITIGGVKVGIKEFTYEETPEKKPRARPSRLPKVAEEKQADWFNEAWNRKKLTR